MTIIVNTAQCPTCKDILFSRAHHDFRFCTCGETFVDGGFEYVRIGGKDLEAIITGTMEISASKKELYDDWNYSENKYGLIRGTNEIPSA
jgi:hypothetical protein